jgi:hypothetical protein
VNILFYRLKTPINDAPFCRLTSSAIFIEITIVSNRQKRLERVEEIHAFPGHVEIGQFMIGRVGQKRTCPTGMEI